MEVQAWVLSSFRLVGGEHDYWFFNEWKNVLHSVGVLELSEIVQFQSQLPFDRNLDLR